jgi:hypothetical protein
LCRATCTCAAGKAAGAATGLLTVCQ